MNNNLNAEQRQILKAFVQFFLPENNFLTEDPIIELTYVTDVINSIFDVLFDFDVEIDDVFDIFESYGYTFSMVETQQIFRMGAPYTNTNSGLIYINISPLMIEKLQSAIAYLNGKDIITKTLEMENILARLKAFVISKV